MKDKRIECECHEDCSITEHKCVWPDCLTIEESQQLCKEINEG